MAIDPQQDDILRDFLIESREILDGLSEQLVDLEQRPEDRNLLNAVFRGFHTIKGGAGFLNLGPLVDICHQTEDIFNLLRQGDKVVTPELMDTVLDALDRVTEMFARLDSGQSLTAVPASLLERLRGFNVPDTSTPAMTGQGGIAAAEEEDLTDREFELLLDGMSGEERHWQPSAVGEPAGSASASATDDEITDAQFENLLDELHGEGRHPGKPGGAADEAPASTARGDDSPITEEEFERLLDELHGEGSAPGALPESTAPESAAAGQRRSDAEVSTNSSAATAASVAPAAGSNEPAAQRSAPPIEATVRVDTAKLDDIMNLVGELVLVRNRLCTLREQLNDERVTQVVGNLEQVTADLQSAVMKTRMQPIKKVFSRFPRVVRDLARNMRKEIQLTTRGEDTDLDKNLVEALADPLVHLVRNAVDHGLEDPQERTRRGKPRTGSIVLSAAQEGDHILIMIADDGRGMDPEALRAKAIEKGVLDIEAAKRLDDKDSFNLIFLPGFSTKEQISDVSGRGVGMDVVKERLSELNGTVDIDSRLGEGTTLRIKVPLTLAILPTLMVRTRGCKFALPMGLVQEIFELNESRSHMLDGRLTVMVRDKAVPLFFLERWLQRMAEPAPLNAEVGTNPERQVVTLALDHQVIGFVVDEVIGLEEVVIKPLGSLLHGLPGLTGSTITGDGRIALIIDVPGLIKNYGSLL